MDRPHPQGMAGPPVDTWLLCVSIWPLAVLHLICWFVAPQNSSRKFLIWRTLGLLLALLCVICPLLLVHVRWKQLGDAIWQDWWASALAAVAQLALIVLQYLFWILGSWCLLQLPSYCGAPKLAGVALLLGMVSGFLANAETRNWLAVGFVSLTELLRNGDSEGWWMVASNQTQALQSLIVSNSTILKEGLDECDGVSREPICLQLCRQKDLFLPTWPLVHGTCTQLISWQIFGFANERSLLWISWNWLVALFYVLLGLFLARCSTLPPVHAAGSTTLMLSEGALDDAATSGQRPVWPDVYWFRARGPYEEGAKSSWTRWLYKSLSSSDWEASRKELAVSLVFVALQNALHVATAFSLLADGQPAFGCLLLMCIFLPSFDDLLNFRLISAVWRCFERGFAGPEVWWHQWRRGFFEGISSVLVCTLTLYFTPQLNTSTLVCVQLCIASSLLFSIPNGCSAAWLLQCSFVPGAASDFYEIQRAVDQLGLRCYRRSLVFLFLVCLVMRFPTTFHPGWRMVWAVLIQYTVYLEVIPEIRQFFGLQVDSVLSPKTSLERSLRDTLSPRRTSVEQSCSVLQRLGLLALLVSLACHLYFHVSEAGELQLGLFLVCQISLICLQLLDCFCPPLGWEEPPDTSGSYEIDVDRVVTQLLSPDSSELGLIKEGTLLEVLEVEEVLEGGQCYVRGRVKEGWITLRRKPGTSNDIFAFRRLQ